MTEYTEDLHIYVLVFGPIVMCGFPTLALYISKEYLTKNALGWIFFSSWAFSVFLWIMLFPVVKHYADSLAERLSRRWRLKFYEAIARERQAAYSV